MTTLVPKFEQPYTGSINRAFNSKFQEMVSVKDFGATGDGTTDDSPYIRAAFTAWASAATAGTPFKLYVPQGTYKLGSTINLRTMFAAQNYYGLDFEMSSQASFAATANIGTMIDFSCPEGGGFSFCRFIFGQIGGGLLAGNNTGIIFRNVSTSTIYFNSITAWSNSGTGTGINFVCSSANGCYTNLITIGALLSCYAGFVCSDSGVFPNGFQGNMVTIGYCAFNNISIWLLNQSSSNTFTFGTLESNTTRGVLDQSGYNIYRLNFADGTSGNEIEFGNNNGRVDVEGYGFTILNTGNAKGWAKDNKSSVTPVSPTIPASNTPYQNLYLRPATVSISGGSNVSIYIDSVIVGSSGSFNIPYGSFVDIIYTTAPTWVWTFN